MTHDTEHALMPLQRRGMAILAGAAWCGTLVVLVCSAFAPGIVWPLLALVTAIVPTWLAVQRRADAVARIAMGLCLPLYPAILLAQWSGSAWIIDLHMLFFAVIATVVVLADWRPVLAAAGITAVHHLVLNFGAPEFVFNDGGNFGRVVLHAVIVVMETAVLMLLARQVHQLVVTQAEAEREKARLEEAANAERNAHLAQQRVVIEALRQRLLDLSQGQVRGRITDQFPDSYDELRISLNDTCDRLEELLGEVGDVSIFISRGVAEIRAASDDLSVRTERQASALESNSSLTRRLSQQISQTAARAGDADAAIGRAQQDAIAGGEVVEAAVTAMTELEQSAREIGQIIALIDGIAFQTNLLALNAGVEAARAGEAGKGFAVVASEVRTLAQRTADAANTVKQLVQGSTAQVDRGVDLVGQTGKALEAIVGSFGQIGSTVAEIAGSAASQASELEQVTGAFQQIDESTQQNAAMVEQSTAAAHGLSREVDRLVACVSKFDTGRATSAVMRRAA